MSTLRYLIDMLNTWDLDWDVFPIVSDLVEKHFPDYTRLGLSTEPFITRLGLACQQRSANYWHTPNQAPSVAEIADADLRCRGLVADYEGMIRANVERQTAEILVK